MERKLHSPRWGRKQAKAQIQQPKPCLSPKNRSKREEMLLLEVVLSVMVALEDRSSVSRSKETKKKVVCGQSMTTVWQVKYLIVFKWFSAILRAFISLFIYFFPFLFSCFWTLMYILHKFWGGGGEGVTSRERGFGGNKHNRWDERGRARGWRCPRRNRSGPRAPLGRRWAGRTR